jgi:hypothetical protein
MDTDDPNPFITKHREDAVRAWKIRNDSAASSSGVAKM